MKAAITAVSIGVAIFALVDGSGWGIIAAGCLFGMAFAAPTLEEKRDLRRRQRWTAMRLTRNGYCCEGYDGYFDPGNIHSRCNGECFDMCYRCNLLYLSGEKETERERRGRRNLVQL